MTAGMSTPDRNAAHAAPARCRAWVRERPHAVHHLVCATAMLACVLGDHRPVSALLGLAGLVMLSIPLAVRARGSRSAHELVLDLAVMTVVMLAMVPWASHAAHSSSASMAVDGHGGGAVGGAVMLLASACWVVARTGLLVSAGAPRSAAALRAVLCLACLAWMVA
jgi:hypothetical protein